MNIYSLLTTMFNRIYVLEKRVEALEGRRRDKLLEVNEHFVSQDELYTEAKETVVACGYASASVLQRRLRIGYARAARLLDLLEEDKVIGPQEGAKPRKILIDFLSDSDDKENDIENFKL